MDEQRLIAIETKLAHNEMTIEELHQVMYEQQKTIDKLNTVLNSLTKRLQEVLGEGSDIRGPNEKPPHY
jgi:SlyX protein